VGSVYATWTQQGYWNHSGHDRQLQLGYTNSYKNIPYSLNLNLERRADGSSNRQIAVSVSIPLGKAGETSQYASASLSLDNDGLHESTGISGSMLSDQRLSYSLQTDHSPSGGMSGSASVNYRASAGEFGVTHSQARDHAQTSVEAAGGVVIHRHGVTFSQPLGETAALIAAPAATGIGIQLSNPSTGEPYPLNKWIRINDGATPGNYPVNMNAAYYQYGDKVTPGEANGIVTFEVDMR
jgi:outer membrane usher protein